LDAASGPFNTCRASSELGRNYLGLELDKDSYEECKI